MTMIRVPEYEVVHMADYAYRCDYDGCPAASPTPLTYRWIVVVPDGDYGEPVHFCPLHREVQGE